MPSTYEKLPNIYHLPFDVKNDGLMINLSLHYQYKNGQGTSTDSKMALLNS